MERQAQAPAHWIISLEPAALGRALDGVVDLADAALNLVFVELVVLIPDVRLDGQGANTSEPRPRVDTERVSSELFFSSHSQRDD